MTRDSASERVVLAFQERYWTDLADGRSVSLASYLAQWPEHQGLIAEEFLNVACPDLEPEEPTEGSSGRLWLGHYRLEEEIGRGGQGVVHLATDTRLGRRVALKSLSHRGPGAEDHLQRFRREAEITARLAHPGICTIHDAGMEGGVPYIAMQYVEGETLAARIARAKRGGQVEAASFLDFEGEDSGEAPVEDDKASTTSSRMTSAELGHVLRLTELVARALHVAHEAGIVHRDIKPGNIMLDREDQPVVLDFGLAHDDDSALGSLTQTGDFLGTPAYMSPEQIAGHRVRIDARSDVYSLGVTLYECLTLVRPIEAPTREGLLQAILTRDPTDARSINRSLPRDVSAVLEKAMAKDRERRYDSAAAFADDLAALREHRPVTAKPVGQAGRVARWARRRPALATFAVLAVLGLSVVGGLGGFITAKLPDIRAEEEAERMRAAEAELDSGFDLLHVRRYAEAATRFERALTFDPVSVEAVSGLSWALILDQRPSEALLHIEEVAARLPDPAILTSTKSDVLMNMGRQDEAEELASQVPRPDSSRAWFVEGNRAWQAAHGTRGISEKDKKHLFFQAKNLFLRAVDSSPRARQSYHYQLAHATSDVDAQAGPSAIHDVLSVLWPDDARTWHRVGSAHMKSAPDEAIVYLERALAIEPSNRAILEDLVIAFDQAGRIDDADRGYLQMLEVHSGHETEGEVRSVYANFLFRKKRFEAAVAQYRHLLIDDPHSKTSLHGLANSLALLVRLPEAHEAYDRWIAAYPNDPEPYFLKGVTSIRQRDYEAALSSMTLAHELGRGLGRGWTRPSARHLTSLVRARVRALKRADRADDALRLLEEYVFRFPELDEIRATRDSLKDR